MSKLEAKILDKGKHIVKEIEQSAKTEAKALKEKLLKEATLDFEILLDKELSKAEQLVKQAKSQSERELRDAVAIAKQQLISNIFVTLKDVLKNLKPADLFNYVLKSIQSEKIDKSAEIRVAKSEYAVYQSLLSSKKGALVEADLLNEKLGPAYQLKLSQTPAQISSGFLIVGKDYDLNFSLENLTESLSKKYEKTIYEALN